MRICVHSMAVPDLNRDQGIELAAAVGFAGIDLIVSDEGRGFNVGDTMEKATAGKALGLLGMQERVSMLGGQVAIESTPGEGTVIRASMPVEVES